MGNRIGLLGILSRNHALRSRQRTHGPFCAGIKQSHIQLGPTKTFLARDWDMHAFLVDESAWTYYWDEKFAPAFVVWNSEVGASSVGIRAGWYHAGTSGFILNGDSCPVSYSRRHARGVKDSLCRIGDAIQVWLAAVDGHSDSLMKQLASARTETFGKAKRG